MTRRDVAAASPSRTAEGTDPRVAAAREVLAILRRALPADGQLELILAPGGTPTRTAAARRGFEDGSLDVAQLLLARPGPNGPAELPLRPWWRA